MSNFRGEGGFGENEDSNTSGEGEITAFSRRKRRFFPESKPFLRRKVETKSAILPEVTAGDSGGGGGKEVEP